MSVTEQFDADIKELKQRGALDGSNCESLIEVARKLAMLMDDADWPMTNGKIDNVSPAVFLKYCDALGITPSVDGKQSKQRPKSKLATITSTSKFAKASNG